MAAIGTTWLIRQPEEEFRDAVRRGYSHQGGSSHGFSKRIPSWARKRVDQFEDSMERTEEAVSGVLMESATGVRIHRKDERYLEVQANNSRAPIGRAKRGGKAAEWQAFFDSYL